MQETATAIMHRKYSKVNRYRILLVISRDLQGRLPSNLTTGVAIYARKQNNRNRILEQFAHQVVPHRVIKSKHPLARQLDQRK